MTPPFAAIMTGVRNEAQVDIIGLWEIIENAQRRLPEDATRSEIEDLTFLVVEAMLAEGFVAGDMAPMSTIKPWNDQNPGAVISIARSAWRVLGRNPHPGEIIYFTNQEKLMARP